MFRLRWLFADGDAKVVGAEPRPLEERDKSMTSCGYRAGTIWDPTRRDWRNQGARPIHWAVWYPCRKSGAESGRAGGFFEPGAISHGAPLAGEGPYPVVLLSHGTGGIADSLGWLARALVAEGFVVIGANHHGNTGAEDYRAEGFLCWWERAPDLSVLLTEMSQSGPFAGRLDLARVSVAGFSLGGYTALALAGARTSMENFHAWCAETGIDMRGPREFPDVADHVPELMETSAEFRQSWDRQSDDFCDPRIKSVVAIAPAPPVRGFFPDSLATIQVPVTLITGGADIEAPTTHCADWLVERNPGFAHHEIGADVGHYTFLDLPADRSMAGTVDIFTDAPGVDRAAVHTKTSRLVIEALV